MPAKATRARMTHAQKLALRVHHNANPELAQQELAVWTKITSKLPVVPCKMTLSRVLDCPVSDIASNLERKTHHRVSSAELEEQLVLWIRQCEQYRLPVVTGATIRAKADKIRHELVSSSTPEEILELKALMFSSGWLNKSQDHYRLPSRHTHGEAASVSIAAVERERVELQDIARGYERYNVFNMDETAFFTARHQRRAYETERIAGRKQQKKRLRWQSAATQTALQNSRFFSLAPCGSRAGSRVGPRSRSGFSTSALRRGGWRRNSSSPGSLSSTGKCVRSAGAPSYSSTTSLPTSSTRHSRMSSFACSRPTPPLSCSRKMPTSSAR